ncbi:hypothetical protein D3C77_663710 [compost metagenome]
MKVVKPDWILISVSVIAQLDITLQVQGQLSFVLVAARNVELNCPGTAHLTAGEQAIGKRSNFYCVISREKGATIASGRAPSI